ncbi:hypothetical protein BV898_09741 [Hypsibius exemplaris]|uniref:G-protein coupled receptors family 1 profile domain-containing protein n=1 Tax=Hypsibius exemplaris TaxID=2072580 RepID=A0A1W0WLM9_HYPEX|nr:hypothetical protein BV898_09741 [Hypsibius exemplaris]
MEQNFTVSTSNFSVPLFTAELIASFTLKFILNFAGGFANLFLLIVCCCSHTKKTFSSSGTKWLVFQYTAAYFLISMILYPARDAMIMGHTFHLIVPGMQHCSYFAAVNMFFVSLANWTDLALACNRLMAICFPIHYVKWTTRKVIAALLIAAWVVSFAIVLPVPPLYLGWPGNLSLPPPAQCSNLNGSASLFVTSMTNFVPYAVSGVIYAAIWFKIVFEARHRRVTIPMGHGLLDVKQMRAKMRQLTVSKMLMAVFVWNSLCMLPFFVVTLAFPELFVRKPTLSLWLRLIMSVQYLFSPVIFFVFSEEYRKTARRLFSRVPDNKIKEVEKTMEKSETDSHISLALSMLRRREDLQLMD